MHCLRLSGAKVLLVDADEGLRSRIEEARSGIEELGMRTVIIDEESLGKVRSQSSARIEDAYREGVRGNWPMAMFYTRFVVSLPASHFRYANGYQVVRLVCRRVCHFRLIASFLLQQQYVFSQICLIQVYFANILQVRRRIYDCFGLGSVV